MTYRVELVDGGLLLLRRPDWSQPLEPTYEDAFTSRSYLVRFVRDASGRVSELSLGAGRVRDLRLQRLNAPGEDE